MEAASQSVKILEDNAQVIIREIILDVSRRPIDLNEFSLDKVKPQL